MLPSPHFHYRRPKFAVCLLVLAAIFSNAWLHAAPITAQQALEAAYAWASLSSSAMQEQHGQIAGTVTAIPDALGETAFYVIDLTPRGYVIIAADDGVEPVIAFSATDNFEAAPGNPLYDVLRNDLPARMTRARGGRLEAPDKWRMLRAVAHAPKFLTPQAAILTAGGPPSSSVSDVRVSPLLKSLWNQTTESGIPVFNYYTPPYGAGNTSNYYAGCVATMLAQIMRFHQWPQDAVGNASFHITVNNSGAQRSLRGGDGAGGSYVWSDMALAPGSNVTTAQQQAIGALLVDAGVASNMDYEANGSGAYLSASVLTKTFHYANAAYSEASLGNLDVAIDANLDAGLPVGLGISGNGEGHAVVADGYGFNAGTEYHHLNMGWSGAGNAWYNLPRIVAGGYDFNTVNSAIFNIDPLVKGEIVSGRVTNGGTAGVAGVTVTAVAGSVVFTATTNAVGIYAFKGLASNTKYTIAPDAQGLAFTPASLSVSTGHSSTGGSIGDKTGENFASQLIAGSVTVQLNSGAAASGAKWRVNSGAWQTSGAMLSGVPAGTATITFLAVKGWSAPAGQQVTVVKDQTTSAQAIFSPQFSLVATPDNTAGGSVSADPQPGDLGSYAAGTTVTLTATPAAGYYFGGWVESGTLVSTAATYTSVVNGARTLVANFPPDTLTGQNAQVYVTSTKASDTINVLAGLTDTAGALNILSVTQPANGTVTINADGTLTFTPGKSFRGSTQFSITAGDGNGASITRLVTISNWFTASAGTYAGLSMADAITNETSGYLKATVTASGAFSGKLTVAGISYSVSGAFDSNANCQKVIRRKNASNLNLSLHLDPASEIAGTVGDGVTQSNLVAQHVNYSASAKAPQAGKYTALLSGTGPVPGSGYFVITVAPTGALTATGRLADGTPVSTAGYVNPDGTAQFYAGVYPSATGAGSVFGTIDLQPGGAQACSGTFAWFRPASSGAYYPGGFAETGSVNGSQAPTVKLQGGIVTYSLSIIATQLSGGGLAEDINENGSTITNGVMVWNTANLDKMALTINPAGQVSGSFIDPATGVKRTVLGVWLADQHIGGGFFVGGTSAGAFTLSSQ